MYRQLAVLSLFVIVSFAQSIPTFPSQYTTNFTGQTGISHNPANFKGELFIDTVDLQARFNEFLPTDGVYLIDISYCQSVCIYIIIYNFSDKILNQTARTIH